MQIRGLAFSALALILSPSVAMAAGGSAAASSAQPSSKLSITMTIYAAGITLGKVDLDATLRPKGYQAISHLETAGVVNAFWKAKIQASSSGEMTGSHLQPAIYNSYSINRDNPPRELSVTFEPDQIRVYSKPAYKRQELFPITDAQKHGSFDPVSAIIYIMSGIGTSSNNPCDVTAPVFDGRRRYDIQISKQKNVTVDMDNGLYKGPAVQCEAQYKQVAGYRQQVLDDAKKFPKIKAWMTTIASKERNGHYVVPLRVWANTPYGLIAAVTTSLKIDGKEIGSAAD